jgi:starch synthase
MNILIVSTELSPYSQVSQAADAVASLTKALRLLGHEVTLALPRLPGFEAAGLMAARRLTPLELGEDRQALVFDVALPSGARLVLIDSEDAQMQALGAGGEAEARALGVFSDAVAHLVAAATGSAGFEVVHAHGARAGLALLKLRKLGAAGVGQVLTVHDGSELCEFSSAEAGALGISEAFVNPMAFKSGDDVGLLKGVIGLADVVIAPSDAYASALLLPERFGPIARSFRAQGPVGVLGGVDHAVFNPATDSALPCRYDAQDPTNKGRCKSTLLHELGLPVESSRPLVFFEDVAPGDGALETLLAAAPGLSRLEITLVVQSTATLSASESAAVEALSGQVLVLGNVDARLRRRLLSAADFYLSAERHNPSGQRLLQAARYGAVPVALAVDAARDAVVDADAELKSGTGISFDAVTGRAIEAALARAVAAYRRPTFLKLVSRLMRQDLAWDRPARRHLQLYRQAAGATH